jgi:hypothetical protein
LYTSWMVRRAGIQNDGANGGDAFADD